jgi:hypothetical protein
MWLVTQVLIIVLWQDWRLVDSQLLLANYSPSTSVVQQTRIDLDYVEMGRHMTQSQGACNSTQTAQQQSGACFGGMLRFDLAERLYQEGGHSSKRAVLEVNPLPVTVSIGDDVSQVRANDSPRNTVAIGNWPAGSNSVEVTYTSIQRPCFGGASTEDTVQGAYGQSVPLSSHCLDVDSAISTNGVNVGVPLQVTNVFRSLQELGTGSNMAGETYYEQFVTFYGADYAHRFFLHQVSFTPNAGAPIERTGNAFGADQGGVFARRALSRLVMIYMTLWMQVVHQLESAVASCTPSCASENCQETSLHAWDQAVAFYTGSMCSGGSKGILLYAATDHISQDFGTCSNLGNSTTNERIFEQFRMGQRFLQQGNCNEAGLARTQIVKAMAIPIIQQSLKAAQALADPENTDFRRDRLHAAFYAKIMRPLLHMCDPGVAETIANHMETDDLSLPLGVSYAEFKGAIESTYPCMGLSCADVGGLIVRTQVGCVAGPHEYVVGAEPCGLAHSDSTADIPIALIVIVTLAVLLGCFACCGIFYWWGFRQGRRYTDLEFSAVHNRTPDKQGGNDIPPDPIGLPAGSEELQ